MDSLARLRDNCEGMRRFSSSSLCLFSIAIVVSCKVGDTSSQGPGPSGDSDAAVATADGGGDGVDAQAADPDCEELAAPNGSGQHNPGLSCVEAGCHDGGGEPPLFTLAGTLYLDQAGTTPLAGATLVFTDNNAVEIKLRTSSNGNFYTNQDIAFPIQAKASLCPNSLSMTAPIDQAMGNCNQAGCHVAGNRIYVPE